MFGCALFWYDTETIGPRLSAAKNALIVPVMNEHNSHNSSQRVHGRCAKHMLWWASHRCRSSTGCASQQPCRRPPKGVALPRSTSNLPQKNRVIKENRNQVTRRRRLTTLGQRVLASTNAYVRRGRRWKYVAPIFSFVSAFCGSRFWYVGINYAVIVHRRKRICVCVIHIKCNFMWYCGC